MKKLFSKLFIVGALGLFAMSCSDDEEVVTNPDDEFDVELAFSDIGDVSESVNVTPTQGTVKARVQITAASTIRRIYITRNVGGAGDEPYTPADLSSKTTKADGSLDVESDAQPLDYTLNLAVPSSISQGTVVYKFWATSGRGDHRDPSKRAISDIGSIVLEYGGANSNPVKSYTAKIFAAPLADGSSNTFISLLDGKLYKINQGQEYAARWDFGYYYGNTLFASLAAADNYPSSIIDVPTVAGTTELNSCYFALSTLTATDFDDVAISGDLNSIATPTSERINGLEVGDIVEFVDNYGKKGLIKVTALVAGTGSNGSMTIDIKVQP